MPKEDCGIIHISNKWRAKIFGGNG